MKNLNVDVMNVVKKKRFGNWVIVNSDPTRNLRFGNENEFSGISIIERNKDCLDDNTPSDVITGNIDGDDDPQTVLELLGI